MEDVVRALLCHVLEIHESLGQWVLVKWLTTAGTVLWELTFADDLDLDLTRPLALVGDAEVLVMAENANKIIGGYDGSEVTMILEPAGEPTAVRTIDQELHQVAVPAPHVLPMPGAVPAGAAG